MINNKKGQGLVELIVAIAIIEIGLFSVWSLFLSNFNAERETELRIVAVNLAREGIEIVKNNRDSNWLKRRANTMAPNGDLWTWDQNLKAGTSSATFASPTLTNDENFQLYLDDNGYYSNDAAGKATPYSRKIILKDICCTNSGGGFKCDNTNFITVTDGGLCGLKIGLNVVSVVDWRVKGEGRQEIIEDNLYDWQ